MSADFNFNFRNTMDPLLMPSGNDFYSQFGEIEKAQKALDQRKQAIMQLASQAEQEKPQPVSNTPLWDELDSITGDMTEAEFDAVRGSKAFQDSSEALMAFANAALLQMVRPYVEQSPEGKKLLEQHVTNIKFLKKSASAEVDRQLSDFREYTEKFSHMSWDEYLAMKQGEKK